MDRREFIKLIGGSVAAAAGALSCTACSMGRSNKPNRRPNIVLIMADDMGYSDIGCYGGEICTPNLDRLAAGGLRFTQFYNNSICVPTRASLLTGLYSQQVGVHYNTPTVMKNCVTLAEVLRSAGYRTLMTGKWHAEQIPCQRGFDRYFGLADGCCNYFNPGPRRAGEGEPGRKLTSFGYPRRWAIDDKVYLPYKPKDKNFYTTDAFTDYAIDYLQQYGREERPFFLYVAYTAPHYPLHAWGEDITRYRGKYMVGWDKLRQQRFERMVEMGLVDKRWGLSPRDEEVPKWDSVEDKDSWDLKMAVYAAMIDRMDRNIGRIIAKIRQLGKEDNTLVLFLSDNGGTDYVLLSSSEPNDSIFNWEVTPMNSDSCLVKIVAYDPSLNYGEDSSNGRFSIKDPTGVGEEEEEEDEDTPKYMTTLEQNYPNPFNGVTNITYTLSEKCFVDLRIYDTTGRLIKIIESRKQGPGRYDTVWNGTDNAGRLVTSGVFFCRIKAGKVQQARKIVYLR